MSNEITEQNLVDEKQILNLVKKIKKAFPEVTELEDKKEVGYLTVLKVHGVPGFVNVMPHGINMTFNNTIPQKVAVRVLKAISEK